MFILFLIIMLIIFLLPHSLDIIKYFKGCAEHRRYLKQFENIGEIHDDETVPTPKKNEIAGVLTTALVIALFVGGLILISDKPDSSKESSVMNTVDAEKNITESSANKQTTSQTLSVDDVLKLVSEVRNGEGYSFVVTGGWKLLESGEGYDFDILMNIPYTERGVISAQIKHFYLSETLFDGETLDFDTYVNYDYELSKLIFSWSEEDVFFSDSIEKSLRIGNSTTYEYYIEQSADIVSLDLSKAEYGTDEYGNIIITNIDSLSLVTHHDIPCRSKYYYVENGDEVIEINITYTIENEDNCMGYIDNFLDGITLEN